MQGGAVTTAICGQAAAALFLRSYAELPANTSLEFGIGANKAGEIVILIAIPTVKIALTPVEATALMTIAEDVSERHNVSCRNLVEGIRMALTEFHTRFAAIAHA